jgi:hypothetical protein
LKHLRCSIQVWDTKDSQGSDYGYRRSQPESPERATRVLYNLARGHALLTGRNYITLEDVPIVIKTALSTAVISRVDLLYLLIAKNGTLNAREIAGAFDITEKTALNDMTTLRIIGLVNIEEKEVPASRTNPPHKTKHMTLKEEFNWLLGEDFQKLLEGFKPVDYRPFMKDEGQQANNPPKNKIEEQMSTARQVYDRLEDSERSSNPGMEVDKTTISEQKFHDELVAVGISQSDAAMIIESMKRDGFVEQVDGWGTLRRKVKP